MTAVPTSTNTGSTSKSSNSNYNKKKETSSLETTTVRTSATNAALSSSSSSPLPSSPLSSSSSSSSSFAPSHSTWSSLLSSSIRRGDATSTTTAAAATAAAAAAAAAAVTSTATAASPLTHTTKRREEQEGTLATTTIYSNNGNQNNCSTTTTTTTTTLATANNNPSAAAFNQDMSSSSSPNSTSTILHNGNSAQYYHSSEAMKQLLCGGVAGSVAKTLTAPFSRLTILFQVHSLVTTKGHRPYFATSIHGGIYKIIERGGIKALWKGNMTSVLHRFPYSAINFYMYENTMDVLASTQLESKQRRMREQEAQTQLQMRRRLTRLVYQSINNKDEDGEYIMKKEQSNQNQSQAEQREQLSLNRYVQENIIPGMISYKENDSERNQNQHHQHHQPNRDIGMVLMESPAAHKFIAGAVAGTMACMACYPLDLVRTRLTTELEGHEHYRGIVDAFRKIYYTEGLRGFYSGLGPTLLVAVPNFAISYTVYGTLKEYTLDDDLFYNLRKINHDSGEEQAGFILTVLCGAASGILATLVTFPMDTIRRRMQVQNLHVRDNTLRLTSYQTLYKLIKYEGLSALYRGLTPELLKVIPYVGTMFTVYESTKEMLNVTHERDR